MLNYIFKKYKFLFVICIVFTIFTINLHAKIISGQVTDRQGNSIENAIVKVCYISWGWSSKGYPIWDKEYCSKPVKTDKQGRYKINFKQGYVVAKKKGWVQTADFNSNSPKIILVDKKTYFLEEKNKIKKLQEDQNLKN